VTAWRLRAGSACTRCPSAAPSSCTTPGSPPRQISSELTPWLAGAAAAAADPPPPALAAELRLGLDDGWLLHHDEKHAENQAENWEERDA
jgi:hypothetical protein